MSFETLAGIYVYCMDYHEGQWSRLYRLMSRISKMNIVLKDSSIAAIKRGRDDRNNEWEQSRIVYRKLKRRNAR